MARNLAQAGFELLVCDTSEVIRASFEAEGVRTTDVASDCGSVDAVIVLVATIQQMRDVLLGERGIAAGVADGPGPLVLMMSTVGRAAVLDVAAALDARGMRMLDVPISGGPFRAEAGTLSIMVSGDKAAAEEADPVLRAVGSAILYCGEVGASQTVKVLNNIIGGLNTYMMGEVGRIALQYGMTLHDVLEVLEASTGRNWLSVDANETAKVYRGFTDDRRNYESVSHILHKDFALAGDLLDEADGEFPIIRAGIAALDTVGEETFENWKFTGNGRIE